jgi:hypothetical protein
MPLYLYNGALLLKNGLLAGAASCCCCSGTTPELPLSVYRTGGLANSGTTFNPAGCGYTLIGQITATIGAGSSIDVPWPPVGTAPGTVSNSVETQVKDACGRCVFSANSTSGGGVRAVITVNYSNCRIGAQFVNTPPWCNNPMCPLPW